MDIHFPTFEVAEPLGANIRVKLASGQLVAADGTDTDHLGLTNLETFEAGELVSLTPAGIPGTLKMVASGAIAQNAKFEYDDDGKIAAFGAGTARGVALDAATADGDVIRVIEFK